PLPADRDGLCRLQGKLIRQPHDRQLPRPVEVRPEGARALDSGLQLPLYVAERQLRRLQLVVVDRQLKRVPVRAGLENLVPLPVGRDLLDGRLGVPEAAGPHGPQAQLLQLLRARLAAADAGSVQGWRLEPEG